MKIALCLLLSLAFSLRYASLIEWTPEYRLVWDDFKARPDVGSPNAALTSTAIKFNFSYGNSSLKYHISCQFDKNLSWGRVKNDYILSHEQGHFDIAEINARRLNRELQGYTVGTTETISKDLNAIYQKNMRELRDMQTLYDSETDFSRNPEKQAEWLKKIKTTLKELEKYADYR
jgi:predicted secreted Zn-dependent protease